MNDEKSLRECAPCRITLRSDERVGLSMGDGFFCSDPHCPIMRPVLDALARREHLEAQRRDRKHVTTGNLLTFTFRPNTPPSGPPPAPSPGHPQERKPA